MGQGHDTEGQTQLAAYVVAGGAAEMDIAALRVQATARLPEAMVPTTLTRLEALPLTPNGKLDRRALPEPALPRCAVTPPRDPVEAALAAIWADLLGLDAAEIDRTAAFADLGGDSILSLKMLARIRRQGIAGGQKVSLVNRGISSRNENATGVTSDTSLEVKFATGPVAHTLLTGIDYYRAYLNSERYQTGTVGPLDVYNPIYGLTTPRPNFRINTGSKSLIDQVGLYAQDQIKFDRFVLLLGGRQDFAKTQNLAYLTGQKIEQNDSAFSGRAGLVYLGDYGVAPYVSYSQSFATFAQTDRAGNPFQPATGEQYEGGVRWQIPDADTLLSGAVYQSNQKNALVPDPVNTAFSIQTGEVRSQGFEIEGRTNFGPLQLVASYSYTDARTTQTTNPTNLNQRVAVVSYHLASAFGTYELGTLGIPGLRLGGGVRYIGSANIPGFGFDTKEATLFDFVGLYDFGVADPSLAGWRAQLNIRNLADRVYVTCATGSACTYNEPRNVFGTIKYRW